jgi:protein-S-isoprenylcysteine O-methyltransferase Ste14
LFVLARALAYATVFVGLLLVLLPGRVLSRWGVVRPDTIGAREILGIGITLAGSALAVWCLLAFVIVGKGTPAPFDPPRQLVVAGPYRYVRNPMYIGAGLALEGAAVYTRSLALLGYAALLLVAAHVFVVRYEEPALARRFGDDYRIYRRAVRRWWPRRRPWAAPGASTVA